jgi:ankyrin repeat protein
MLRRIVVVSVLFAFSAPDLAAPSATEPASTQPSQADKALADASGRGDVLEIQQALANGADINWRDSEGATAVHRAVASGSLDATKLLLDRGADCNLGLSCGVTPLMSVRKPLDRPKVAIAIAKLLLAHGADPNARDDLGYTPLHRAALWDERGLAELLLANAADASLKDKGGETPLELARKSGSTKVAELLDAKEKH